MSPHGCSSIRTPARVTGQGINQRYERQTRLEVTQLQLGDEGSVPGGSWPSLAPGPGWGQQVAVASRGQRQLQPAPRHNGVFRAASVPLRWASRGPSRWPLLRAPPRSLPGGEIPTEGCREIRKRQKEHLKGLSVSFRALRNHTCLQS